jgi:nucleoside-diphosphate-sugar epimerase
MRILVTGASGFVGRAVSERLLADDHEVRASVRRVPLQPLRNAVEVVEVGDVGPTTDWSAALRGIEAIVHLANRAHVMRETVADPLQEFRRINVEGTKRLASQAADFGVKRLVFVSSIKVLGESTEGRAPLSESDSPNPTDPYGVSKWEAEQALAQICEGRDMTYTVIRPPLLYGPGVKGNIERLLGWLTKGLPLPLGAVKNQRSLMSVSNLSDLLAKSLTDPRAAGQTFVCCDNEALSTPQLIQGLASGLGKPARLLPCPITVLRLSGQLLRRMDMIERLCGSMLVDGSKVRQTLEWSPPFAAKEGLAATARHFARQRQGDLAGSATERSCS